MHVRLPSFPAPQMVGPPLLGGTVERMPGWPALGTISSMLLYANTIIYVPIVVFRRETYDRIAIFINEASSDHAGLARLGVCRRSASTPGELLLDAGTITTYPVSPQLRELSISLTLWPGNYFLLIEADAAGAGTQVATPDPLDHVLLENLGLGSSTTIPIYDTSNTYVADGFPAALPVMSGAFGDLCPWIGLRRSA